MDHRIVAKFDTRRDAETAVEYLVQEHGVDRAAIVVRPAGADNTAGTRRAGADAQSGHPGVETQGEPELSGPIEVCVACPEADEGGVKAALQRGGATRLHRDG